MDRIARMKELVELWNSGDPDAFFRAIGPRIEFRPDPRWPEPGPYSGGEFRRFMEGWSEIWGGDAKLVAREFSEHAEAVLVRCQWVVSGASSGAHVPAEFTFTCWMADDGHIDHLLAFFEHADALAAAEAGPPAG